MAQLNEQQDFWSNKYSQDYLTKNDNFNLNLGIKGWAQMLRRTDGVETVLECGSNVGRNINVLRHLLPESKLSVIELSKQAYDIVTERYELDESFNGTIVEARFERASFDLVFTAGVLIHIHPDDLLANMTKMYESSSKYILMAEYFNRTPTMIEYQGLQNQLFKRDFGKTFMENFEVELLDYGFLWGHIYDSAGFGDITWWLFKKKG